MWEDEGLGEKTQPCAKDPPKPPPCSLKEGIASWVLHPLALLWAMTRGSRCPRSSQGWEGRPGCCDRDGITVPTWARGASAATLQGGMCSHNRGAPKHSVLEL